MAFCIGGIQCLFLKKCIELISVLNKPRGRESILFSEGGLNCHIGEIFSLVRSYPNFDKYANLFEQGLESTADVANIPIAAPLV